MNEHTCPWCENGFEASQMVKIGDDFYHPKCAEAFERERQFEYEEDMQNDPQA